MNKYRKSGQTQVAVGSIVMLVVGVGVAVLVLIFVGVLGGQTYQVSQNELYNIANTSAVNEAFTALNDTYVSLGNTFVQSGTLVIKNGSTLVGLGNFTVDYPAGTILATNSAYNNTALKANYTYGDTAIRDHILNSIKSSFQALENTGNYMPLIVLAVVISLVMVLVLGMTNMSRGGTSAL